MPPGSAVRRVPPLKGRLAVEERELRHQLLPLILREPKRGAHLLEASGD